MATTPEPSTHLRSAVAPESGATPATGFIPKLQAPLPQGMEIVASLTDIEREVLDDAELGMSQAHVPFTCRRVGAAMRCGDRNFWGCNIEGGDREKHCAERTAVIKLRDQGHAKIDLIATINSREGEPDKNLDPICMCGSCRHLVSRYADTDTPILLSSSNRDRIYRTTVGAVYPLAFGAPNLLETDLADPRLLLPSLKVISRMELQTSTHLFEDPQALGYLLEEAEARCASSQGSQREGAALLTDKNRSIAARKIYDGDPEVGQFGAVISAITLGISEGFEKYKALAICADPSLPCGIVSPRGRERQYLFDRAQLAGIDMDIVMGVTGSDRVVTCKISDLLPMGEGPLQSSTAQRNLLRRLEQM